MHSAFPPCRLAGNGSPVTADPMADLLTPNTGGPEDPALTGRRGFAKPQAMRTAVYGLLAALLLVTAPAPCPATLTDDLFLGTEALARSRFSLAAQAFSRALATDPDNAYARSRLALTKTVSGQEAQARKLLEKNLATRDDDLFALWTLGCLDLLDGDAVRARERFGAMEKVAPGNARAFLGQGLADLLVGDKTAAVTVLAKIQTADSQDALVHYLAGLAYWMLDAPANARLELEAALELEPRNTAALELAGLIYRRQGRDSLARSAWEQALTIDPGVGGARLFLSRMAQDEGLAASLEDRPEEAKRAYERALAIDPSNEAAARALGVTTPMLSGTAAALASGALPQAASAPRDGKAAHSASQAASEGKALSRAGKNAKRSLQTSKGGQEPGLPSLVTREAQDRGDRRHEAPRNGHDAKAARSASHGDSDAKAPPHPSGDEDSASGQSASEDGQNRGVPSLVTREARDRAILRHEAPRADNAGPAGGTPEKNTAAPVTPAGPETTVPATP